jgi:hypothetical protein
MLKKALIVISVIAGLMALTLTYLLASNINKEEINRAKTEMDRMRVSRDSIQTVVSFKDSLQILMQIQVSQLKSETDILRNQVNLIEEDRKRDQLTVRSIRKKENLQEKFAETYPEVARSDWGVTDIMNEEQGVEIEYILIPLWFAETFIIDNQNALSFQQQRDLLLSVDSLQLEMGTLKDSLFVLEQQKAEAYKNGYVDAFSKYEALNADYIQVLQKPPKIEWGLPKWGVVAAGVGAGVLIGTQAGN